jgi:hypothetical protein
MCTFYTTSNVTTMGRRYVEQVHADASACIAVADAPVLCTYETTTCLTGVDFSDYQFISIDKKGFHSCNARTDGESAKS